MKRFDNPFHDLWVTELLSPTEFVKMFSPNVASHAEELFGTGNVIIKGRQGSGKSMLLGLLNTKTRIAYARSDENYPAPAGCSNCFISAGVHLIKDNARMVSSRLKEQPEDRRKEWAATTFADYINYLLARDLIENLFFLVKEQAVDGVLKEEIPVYITESKSRKVANKIKNTDAWYGYLDDCCSLEDILEKIRHRISSYKRYFNFNSDRLPVEIESSKTDIGEPVAVLAEALRSSLVVPEGCLFYLRIDQHEELYELEKATGNANIFRQVINRALAMRDGRVAYRIGTRHYAWDNDIKIWGSGAHLENMRDYTITDIDYILKRHENPSLGASFEDFAQDVFIRRLNAYGIPVESLKGRDVLSHVFGETSKPKERAILYIKDKKKSLKFPSFFSDEWRDYLNSLWQEDPLQAWLIKAWLQQRLQVKRKTYLSKNPPVEFNIKDKQYWAKERNEAALVQLAGEMKEMVRWGGRRQIIDLAGWNILAFMTICRAIWAAWLRSSSDETLEATTLPRIGLDHQLIGISEGSRIWAEKLKEGADGDKRYSFINFLGTWFSKKVREDKLLSNPGHTGFSLLKHEFEEGESEITLLIKSCRDQGDLIESDHTTKEPNGLLRIKWYLNPLLCPYYRIPYIRTKEPIYISVSDLEEQFKKYKHQGEKVHQNKSPKQSDLFED